MGDIKYTNVSNLAAFGVEWVAGETGNRYQLVNSRGTTGLTFGVFTEHSQGWVNQRVVEPARFGLTEPPKTFKAFMLIVKAYVEA